MNWRSGLPPKKQWGSNFLSLPPLRPRSTHLQQQQQKWERVRVSGNIWYYKVIWWWILEVNRWMDNVLDSLCLSWLSEGFCFRTAPFSIWSIALHMLQMLNGFQQMLNAKTQLTALHTQCIIHMHCMYDKELAHGRYFTQTGSGG